MIGIIIILCVLLYIIYQNNKRIEMFGASMEDCKKIETKIPNDIPGAVTKLGNCITAITGEIETATGKLSGIDDTIIGFINTEITKLVPIDEINSAISVFKSPKTKIYDPLCIAFYDITGMTTCGAARNKADRDNA